MKNINKSQLTAGPEGRPLNSPAFSAAWGRVLGVALLLLSAIPTYAAAEPAPSKLSPDLQSAIGANGMVTVNVQFRSFPTSGYLRNRQSAAQPFAGSCQRSRR